VIPKAKENKSFCDEVFPNSPIAELASGQSGLLCQKVGATHKKVYLAELRQAL
jgi:hypothetical protein